jgi:F-type H+-transporting ATPase subunit epsilon
MRGRLIVAFEFELLTPEAVLIRDTVQELVVPGREGYFGVLSGHEYFVTTLKKGTLTVRWSNKSQHYAVDGGIVQVTPTRTVIAAERAELKEVEPH